MESLSKGTKQLWEDYFEAFVKWGEHHKAQLWLKIESRKLESFISNLDYNYKWISNFCARLFKFYNPISNIFDAWSSDKMILLYTEYDWENDVVIGMKSEYPFKFMICSEEEASNVAPVIKCQSFKHNFNYLLNDIIIDYQMNKILDTNWILLDKNDGTIQYEEIKNPVYNFYQNEKQKINKCSIKNWYWKPKIVRNFNENSLQDLYHEIEVGRVSSDVNEFIFDDCLFLERLYPSGYTNKLDKFQKILSFLEINQRSTVKIKYYESSIKKVNDSPNQLTINSKKFVFAFKGRVYKARWKNWRTKFQDIAFVSSSERNIAIVKWKSLISSNLSIAYADESTYLKSDWYELFWKDEEDWPEKLNMYVIISKSNVIEIVHSNLEIINEMWDLPSLKKIGINAAYQEFDKKYFIRVFEKLPKTLSIELFFYDEESWFLTNKSVWIALFKLKQIEFVYYDSYHIKINFKGQEYNQTNILETKIKASIGNQNKEITILEMRDYFRNKYFEFHDM